jgi:NACHT domain
MIKRSTKSPALRMENPSWLAQPATAGLDRPPTRTRLQILPFHELEWENFERLCYRLARFAGDVEQWAALFGGRGQKQDGIDIYVRRPDVSRYACWQSKRYDRLTVSALKAAVTEFEQGEWAPKSDEFIICTSASIQDTKLQLEIEAQIVRLRSKNLALQVLGQTELSAALKNKAALVRDFFGREWARDFADGGDEADKSLDVADIATMRAELQKLYFSNFSGIDPGIVPTNAGRTDGNRLLPILDRFVEPDVEVADTSGSMEGPSPPTDQPTAAYSDLARDIAAPSRGLQPTREVLRRQVSRWVAEDDHTVIVGDAGVGKSTALRAFALDMLSNGTRFPAVAQRWADCIPIVVPFAFWARLVENNETDVSLIEAVKIWFKKFDVSDTLLALISQCLDERKALLLIDGLDEWSNESAARSTLTLLTTFIKTKGLPAILTGRPSGLARLGALDSVWRQGRLAALSDKQQRTLTTIWFGHLYPAGEGQSATARERLVTTQVSNFFSDLTQAGTLLTLSGVPLLLSGLISLYVRQVALPRSRFQAYKELIELLLEIHPNRRAQAALDRAPRSTVLADATLRRQTLANLAYHKRLQGYDAGCPVGKVRTIIVEHLESLDGAGLPARDAIAGAKELLSVDADTAGLLIEKAPHEIGFIHAVFEETLVGVHLAGWRLEDQEAFIKTHSGDPRWSTSILAMLHALTRSSDVDSLLQVIAAPELAAAEDVVRQTLVAEVVFGDFRCSPRLAAELTPNFVRLVTTESWFPHREAVLRLILEGAVSSGARESIRARPHEWFPDPLTYREKVYQALRHWPKDNALRPLWFGLFNDRPENKRAAAATLAALFAGDTVVEERLHALFLSVADGETLCAALEALMQGWWDEVRLSPFIAAARKSEHLHLRLVGIRGRIKLQLHDETDLDEVLAMADGDRHRMGSDLPGLFQTLAAGWPNNPKVIAAALTGADKYGRREGISAEIAKPYLLHFSQTNAELDSKVGELIRKDEFFFSPAFGMSYPVGQYGAAVRAALDYRLDHINHHMHNDVAHLAIMSGSEHAKRTLIELLKDDQWVFWPVYGLLTGWGMEDEETSAALHAIAAGPPDKVQYLAHHLPEIIADKNACRAKLLEIARLDKIDRLDFLLAGFHRLKSSSADDTEVMETILKHDYSRRGIFDGTADLIAAFGTHPAVRAIALARLEELDAPWEILIEAYATDDEIRNLITRYLSSLPVALRTVLVPTLGRRAGDDTKLKESLSQYRMDSNVAIRTASAIAYYETISGDAEERTTAIALLREDAVATGPWMDMIRQAALAGFIALDELTVFRDLPDHDDKKVSLDIFSFDNNRQLLAYVAKHWERLTAALGGELLQRLSRHGANEWWCWDHLAPFINESAAIRGDFLTYCGRETKALSSRAVEALAREMPRSHLLREHCLRRLTSDLQDVNSSPYEQRRCEQVVGRILARQFAGDPVVRSELEQRVLTHPSAAIVGLALSWKDSPILRHELGKLRAQGDRTMRYVWPDAAYLVSTLASRDEFCSFLGHFLENISGDIWDFLPFCIEPIVARIQTEDGLATHLVALLKTTDSGNKKASVPRLLALANQMSDELREWCENSFAKQSDHSTLAEFGLDIVAGEIRPVAYALLDALSPNRS